MLITDANFHTNFSFEDQLSRNHCTVQLDSLISGNEQRVAFYIVALFLYSLVKYTLSSAMHLAHKTIICDLALARKFMAIKHEVCNQY